MFTWGSGTAREDAERFTAEIKQDIGEKGTGYYSGYMVSQAAKGTPNSTVDILDKNTGEIKTRRYYGPDGRAIRDVDYTNHGNAKNHSE